MTPVDALSREELVLLVKDLLLVNAEQQARIGRLEEEVARLGGGGPPSPSDREIPSFVKPNRSSKEQGGSRSLRKPRPHGFARLKETPTRVEEHSPECCSGCGRKLSGGWLHRTRQVIEIPSAPVEIIEHRFYARHCGVCHRREVARADLS